MPSWITFSLDCSIKKGWGAPHTLTYSICNWSVVDQWMVGLCSVKQLGSSLIDLGHRTIKLLLLLLWVSPALYLGLKTGDPSH